MSAKATVHGVVVAETDRYEKVEGNIYVCTTASEIWWQATYF
jgi:hypothetical protein